MKSLSVSESIVYRLSGENDLILPVRKCRRRAPKMEALRDKADNSVSATDKPFVVGGYYKLIPIQRLLPEDHSFRRAGLVRPAFCISDIMKMALRMPGKRPPWLPQCPSCNGLRTRFAYDPRRVFIQPRLNHRGLLSSSGSGKMRF